MPLPESVHEQAEYESAVSYAAGWQDGYAAAERALAAEIRQATGVTLPDAAAVIRWLLRDFDRMAPGPSGPPDTRPPGHPTNPPPPPRGATA